MAKNIEAPSDLRMAAVQQKKRQAQYNLMEPGNGTPWEDRGAQGMVTAWFKTALQSLTRPAQLTHDMRRPETSSDATGFLIGCGIMWGISSIIHNFLLWNYHYVHFGESRDYRIEPGNYFLGSTFQFVLAPALLWAFVKVMTVLFNKLTTMDRKGKAPPVLTYNVFCYAMGPSLLAIIPVVGPALALLMIFITLNVVGIKRLHVSVGGSIIATTLSLVACIALGCGVYYLGNTAWHKVTGGSIINEKEEMEREKSEYS